MFSGTPCSSIVQNMKGITKTIQNVFMEYKLKLIKNLTMNKLDGLYLNAISFPHFYLNYFN